MGRRGSIAGHFRHGSRPRCRIQSARRRRQIRSARRRIRSAAVRFSPPADRLSPAADVLGKADAALGPQLAGLLWSEKFRTLVESQLESRAGSSGSRI